MFCGDEIFMVADFVEPDDIGTLIATFKGAFYTEFDAVKAVEKELLQCSVGESLYVIPIKMEDFGTIVCDYITDALIINQWAKEQFLYMRIKNGKEETPFYQYA